VAGFDVVRDRRHVRQRISLTGQYVALDEAQTGEENLRMIGRLAGLGRARVRQRTAELLTRFDLVAAARRQVKTYSGGMRRRLDLAMGLVAEPAVVFLDEPTTGLDLRSRQAMWRVITDLAGSGTTIFLTTQYLEEADRLADHIAVLDGGAIVADGTASELKQRVAEQRLELTMRDRTGFADVIGRSHALRYDEDQLTVSVATDGTAYHVRALLDELDPLRDKVSRFAVHSATLDDVFLALTGYTTRPEETAGV
jgi:ABC-2 type transport system ATP-binding protein